MNGTIGVIEEEPRENLAGEERQQDPTMTSPLILSCDGCVMLDSPHCADCLVTALAAPASGAPFRFSL